MTGNGKHTPYPYGDLGPHCTHFFETATPTVLPPVLVKAQL